MSSIKIVFDGDYFKADELSEILAKGKKITAKKLFPLLPKRGIYVTEICIETPKSNKFIDRIGEVTSISVDVPPSLYDYYANRADHKDENDYDDYEGYC